MAIAEGRPPQYGRFVFGTAPCSARYLRISAVRAKERAIGLSTLRLYDSPVRLFVSWMACGGKGAGVLALIIGLGAVTAESRYVPGTQPSVGLRAPLPGVPHSYRHEFERVMMERDRVERFRGNDIVRFWYDEKETPAEDYRALNSTYLFEFSRFTRPFPQLSCDSSIPLDALVVAMSQRADVSDLAFGGLSKCTETGVIVNLLGKDVIQSPSGPYALVFLKVERDRSRWHALEATFDSSGTPTVQLA